MTLNTILSELSSLRTTALLLDTHMMDMQDKAEADDQNRRLSHKLVLNDLSFQPLNTNYIGIYH